MGDLIPVHLTSQAVWFTIISMGGKLTALWVVHGILTCWSGMYVCMRGPRYLTQLRNTGPHSTNPKAVAIRLLPAL